MKTLIHLNSKGMESLIGARSTYDYIFSRTTIIIACVVIVKVCYTIFVWITSTMTTSIKVQKLILMIWIFICCRVWQGKRWETSLWTFAPLSKVIAMIISQSVSWVTIRSFLQGHQSKWVPRSSMIWPHRHHERWAMVRCGKSRQVHSAAKKWTKDKWNASVVGRSNNQMPAPGPTHEWRCARMIFEKTFTKSEANSYSCRRSPKNARN
jgi:hypothetical protein